MRHDFFSDGEEIYTYLFGHTFRVYFILREVSLELVDVMQQSRENDHRAVGKLEQRVEVCDDVRALSNRNVHYFVDLLKDLVPLYAHLFVTAAHEHSL